MSTVLAATGLVFVKTQTICNHCSHIHSIAVSGISQHKLSLASYNQWLQNLLKFLLINSCKLGIASS